MSEHAVTDDCHGADWYRLDNAGKVFPAAASARTTTVFRLAAVLDAPINLARVEASLAAVVRRFPFLNVRLRRGLFWYYLEPSEQPPPVLPDTRYPCMAYVRRQWRMLPLRIRVRHQRIAVEIIHALTDANGGVAFLLALVGEYLRRSGVTVEEPGDVLLPGTPCHPEEAEDAFLRYCPEEVLDAPRLSRAFQLPQPSEPQGVYHVISGTVPAAALREQAKHFGVSVTEFLAGIYVKAFHDELLALPARQRRRLARPIRLDVPVNLRGLLPSRTLRNFFLPLHPEIDPRTGEFSLEESIAAMHHFLRLHLNAKYMRQQIARNVRDERHPAHRAVPLFIKNPVLSWAYRKRFQRTTSSSLSNLGVVKVPDAFRGRLRRLEFLPPPPGARKVSCGVISYGEEAVLSFGRTIGEPLVERRVFQTLRQFGIAARLDSNTE